MVVAILAIDFFESLPMAIIAISFMVIWGGFSFRRAERRPKGDEVFPLAAHKR